MEDVIFRNEQETSWFAEVTLVLDNSDELPTEFSEISVTAGFRSGNEYYINRTPCRLKDIVEMFVDTGIGKDSLLHYRPGPEILACTLS